MPRKNAAQKAATKAPQNGTAPVVPNVTVKKEPLNSHKPQNERPRKRAKLLDDSGDEEADFVPLNGDIKLNINEEYAARFEHNKKREERHRLEEKYGKDVPASKRAREEDEDNSENGSSSDETEDDDGLLGPDDEEFQATLQALKKKDPRIYDKTAKFYTEEAEDEEADGSEVKKEKPMTLKDYHRKNLLERNFNDDGDEDALPTYAQEQEALKNELVATVHADDDMDEEDDDFLTRKSAPEPQTAPTKVGLTEADVAEADRDPETFLSNFLSSRAWQTAAKDRFTALESDDSEEEARAEKFEEMYNMRFEDPSLSNVNILSHSREAVSKYSVRKDELNPRKRAREKERAKKDAAKAEREEEKARLKKLRMEEMEEKVKKIKHAAGLRGKDTDITEWTELLEHDWDDDRWDRELEKRFGDQYYAAGDADSDAEEEDGASKKKKVKKPKFDDDIDIKDLVPNFEDEDAVPDITLSDEEDGGVPVPEATGEDEDVDMADADPEEDSDSAPAKKKKTKKDRQKEKEDKKAASRRDRRILAQLVESTLPTDAELAASSNIAKEHIPFRYRETSPTTYGLTPLDILTASDSQLNTFVGLKKLTPFRDEERKAKDRKKVSKKGRLREWRKEVYEGEGMEAPKGPSGEKIPESGGGLDGEGAKKKKKRKNKKGKADGENGTGVEA